jgi:ERCC4-type nuclease
MLMVDGRVGSVELYLPLKRMLPGKVEKFSLPAGDFTFDGNGPGDTIAAIGIERKRVSDLMNSIRSGRLSGEQLVAMSQVYQFVYLVVEGLYRPSEDGFLQVFQGKRGWTDLVLGKQRFLYAELDGYLTTLELNAAVMVRRTASAHETCIQIVDLYRWWQKDWDRHHAHEAIKHQEGVTQNRASLIRRVAAELPSVGWVRSGAVEKSFGSVKDMINAGEREWMGIEGIGKGIAKKVVGEIRRSR